MKAYWDTSALVEAASELALRWRVAGPYPELVRVGFLTGQIVEDETPGANDVEQVAQREGGLSALRHADDEGV